MTSSPFALLRAGAFRITLFSALLGSAAVALAQQAEPAPGPVNTPPPPLPGAPPESFDEKLIRMLQEHNALSRGEAEELIRSLRQQQAAKPAGAAPAPLAEQPGDVHVHIVPESERKRIEEEVKQDVLATERDQNYGRPEAYPDWLNRISLFGDFRFREQLDHYDRNNAPFIDFNAINTSGTPFDVSAGNTTLPPTLDTTQNREEPRFRLRFGLNGQVNDLMTATFRFASGNTTNPVSTNQTLGDYFNKYTFVIDQAYVDFHPHDLDVWLGRMPKPFVSTNLIFWDDLSFDGVAARWRYTEGGMVQPFLTAGGFAIENTSLNFPSNQLTKQPSRDKWLWSAQLGANLDFGSPLKSTTAVAYYYFQHMNSLLSAPCLAYAANVQCSSDDTIPEFLQKGNTLFEVRNLVPNPANPTGPEYQFFGVASPFHVAEIMTSWDYAPSSAVHVVLTADAVRNIGYRASAVAALNPVNNIDPGTTANPGKYHGGRDGYQVQLLVGKPDIEEFGQWSVLGGYKYVESDAVVDAFNDPDFDSTDGVGGTNNKGYFIWASLGVMHHAWLQYRWFSAQQITGPPLAVETTQIDFNVRF